MKSPPIQYHDDVAHDMVEAFADRGAENIVWPSADVLADAIADVEVEAEAVVTTPVVATPLVSSTQRHPARPTPSSRGLATAFRRPHSDNPVSVGLDSRVQTRVSFDPVRLRSRMKVEVRPTSLATRKYARLTAVGSLTLAGALVGLGTTASSATIHGPIPTSEAITLGSAHHVGTANRSVPARTRADPPENPTRTRFRPPRCTRTA